MSEHDEDGAATRAWAGDTPLRRRNRMPWLIAAVAVLGAAVVVLVTVLVMRSPRLPATDASASVAAVSSTPVAISTSKPPAEVLPPPPELPQWIEIRVQRVRVEPPSTPWDGTREEAGLKDQCRSVSKVVGLANRGAGGGLGLLCGLLGDDQQQSDPTLPDLRVVLQVPGARYASYIAFDRLQHTFDYAFAVPARSVPEDGVVVAVVDADDDSEDGREIGSVRISKENLIAAVKSGRLLPLQPAGLATLEVGVRAYDGSLKQQALTLATSKGGTNVRGFEVNAGDVVRVEASGEWRIGSWHDDLLDPEGYPNRSGPITSNLPAFREANHGAAVALVGARGVAMPVVVNPCIRFVAQYSGTVWVGINDEKPGDNRGDAAFKVFKRGPTAAWTTPGAILKCD